jgi:uncharacterized protein (DUF433 family)
MARVEMNDSDIIGAFSEEDAARLSGVSVGQLRSWDRSGFLSPSYAAKNRRQAYSRVYSFRDIVSLRVLNSLRNEHKVPLQHLRKVSHELANQGNDRWTQQTLYVLGRRVVFDDPRTHQRREVVSGQQVFDIPLKVAIKDTRGAIRDLNKRRPETIGRVIRGRFVMNSRPVFAGTRIPVSAIRSYLAADFDAADILREYPELRLEDVEAVRLEREVPAA